MILRLLLIPFILVTRVLWAQEIQVMDGIPEDIANQKIIFFKYEPVTIESTEKNNKQEKYIQLRRENHNRVIKEFNKELTIATMQYPFQYAITTKSRYKPLINAGYKYILDCNVYDNKHLEGQPNEGELIVFEYYIIDVENGLAYKVFQLDEMKVYDAKLIIKKLIKALK